MLVSDFQSIVIIDYDEMSRGSLKALLESHDHVTRTFRSVAEFLGAAQTPTAKILILGCHRYIAEGIDLLHLLRRRAIDIPVIFSVDGRDDVARSLAAAAGAFAYLERPVSEGVLIEAIDCAASRRIGEQRAVAQGTRLGQVELRIS